MLASLDNSQPLRGDVGAADKAAPNVPFYADKAISFCFLVWFFPRIAKPEISDPLLHSLQFEFLQVKVISGFMRKS